MRSEKVLYVDATVRSCSRTAALGSYVTEKLGGELSVLRLDKLKMPVLDEAFLEMRDNAIASGDFSADIFAPAKMFAEADDIVIAAPYYDLSFPAALKQFFEQINVVGLTFRYDENGACVSLCRAKRLIYVTTAGGSIISDEYGFGYVKALCSYFYGIGECVRFTAEGLDMPNADIGEILGRTKAEADRYFRN